MKSSRLLQSGRLLFALATLYYLIKRLIALFGELEAESILFQSVWLIVSLGMVLGYRTLLVSPWCTLYCSTAELPVSFQTGWTLFQLSQIGKYLPGKIGHFLGILTLCRPLGVSETAAVVSTLQALIFQCVLGLGIGAPVLLLPSTNHFLHNWIVSFRQNAPHFIGLAVTLIVLGCVCFTFLRKGLFLKKMETLQKGIKAMFSIAGKFRLLVTYLMLWIYFGITFFFFVKSIYPIPLHCLPMLIGIYPLAWSVGFLSFITPSGLGVREGILSLLLMLCLPSATATLVSLLSRVWVMSAEILLASVAWAIYCKRKRLNMLNDGITNE